MEVADGAESPPQAIYGDVKPMKLMDFEVACNLKFDVDKGTAEVCLKLVETYINANNLDVLCHDSKDGTTTLKFAERAPELARKEETQCN